MFKWKILSGVSAVVFLVTYWKLWHGIQDDLYNFLNETQKAQMEIERCRQEKQTTI